MKITCTLVIGVSLLALAACSTQPAQVSSVSASSAGARAHTVIYTCDDGRIVQAVYPDTDTAVLMFDDQPHLLRIGISADGARYVGKHWQWWTKGMQQGQLAPLKPGATIASASGVSCTAH